MYYVIEHCYVGPNRSENPDADHIDICTEPARGNMDGRVITVGWCGTTNDWAKHARGEYDTLEQARGYIHGRWDETRTEDPDPYGEDEYVERHRLGALAPMGAEESVDWCEEVLGNVTAEMSDDDLADLIDIEGRAAAVEGYKLDFESVFSEAFERRETLQAFMTRG